MTKMMFFSARMALLRSVQMNYHDAIWSKKQRSSMGLSLSLIMIVNMRFGYYLTQKHQCIYKTTSCTMIFNRLHSDQFGAGRCAHKHLTTPLLPLVSGTSLSHSRRPFHSALVLSPVAILSISDLPPKFWTPS